MKIGIDIEENSRFENLDLEKDEKFLNRIFTKKEIMYCFSKKNYSQHLCARFCAKEALIKALSDKSLSLNEIEISNNENGKPYFSNIPNYNIENIDVSLSHCKTYSCANVIIY